jgi:uncharacterized damage-inducible protein DinB
MAALTDSELEAIAERVFAKRESTLEDEGRAVPRKDLFGTVSRVRHRMNIALESLPESAFEPQPEDENGNEVWSAGQIISHICASQKSFTENIARLVTMPYEQELEELEQANMLPMVDARKAIKTATVLQQQTLRAIPEDDDLSATAEHERFGTLGVRGWLMLVAIHEHSHVKQLNSLAP